MRHLVICTPLILDRSGKIPRVGQLQITRYFMNIFALILNSSKMDGRKSFLDPTRVNSLLIHTSTYIKSLECPLYFLLLPRPWYDKPGCFNATEYPLQAFHSATSSDSGTAKIVRDEGVTCMLWSKVGGIVFPRPRNCRPKKKLNLKLSRFEKEN